MVVHRNEQVKPVVGFEGYFVTSEGRVLSTRQGELRELRQAANPKYKQVSLSLCGTHLTKLVHRIVAEAFIPNPNKLPFVGHLNDDKADNVVANLYWTDPKENSTHNNVHLSIDRSKSFKASKDKFSIPVIGINNAGNTISFSSMIEAEKHGFRNGKISECISGKRKTHGGYKWHKARDFEWRGPEQEADRGTCTTTGHPCSGCAPVCGDERRE